MADWSTFKSTHQRNFVNRQIKATSMPVEYWKQYLDEDAHGPLREDGLYDFQERFYSPLLIRKNF